MDTLHAPFSPSQATWLRYSDEQLIEAYKNKFRPQIGTEIHEWASHQIILGNKPSGIKEVERGIKTHLYEKYMVPVSRAYEPEYGDLLLKHLRYMPGEAYISTKQFVGDCVGFRMESESKLTLSNNINGTADAIRYYPKDNLLRVADLKTGTRPAKIEQVFTYAALYCHESRLDPLRTNFETRIYQNGEIYIEQPDREDINDILQNILHKDEVLKKFEGGTR